MAHAPWYKVGSYKVYGVYGTILRSFRRWAPDPQDRRQAELLLRGEKPSPAYNYFCRYGKPGTAETKYPGEITYRLNWSTEPVGDLGCGSPPPNPGSEISSDTHHAEIAYPTGSIAFTPDSTCYDELKAVAPKLLDVLEQGSDASGQKVLPAGAAPCK